MNKLFKIQSGQCKKVDIRWYVSCDERILEIKHSDL